MSDNANNNNKTLNEAIFNEMGRAMQQAMENDLARTFGIDPTQVRSTISAPYRAGKQTATDGMQVLLDQIKRLHFAPRARPVTVVINLNDLSDYLDTLAAQGLRTFAVQTEGNSDIWRWEISTAPTESISGQLVGMLYVDKTNRMPEGKGYVLRDTLSPFQIVRDSGFKGEGDQ